MGSERAGPALPVLAASLGVLVAAWWAAATVADSRVLPGPAEVAAALAR
jgi:ABC-type nitrate/sulfonate/bicarbonate transport system permease component